MSDAIIEAAARALRNAYDYPVLEKHQERISRAIVAAVTPLIRAAALEEAAKVAMDHPSGSYKVAAAIRALKEQP